MKILAITGSNKTVSPSLNKALIEAASELLPSGMELEKFDISRLPMFSADLENELPAVVASFKQAITSSNGVLIATPEYNRSLPPVLKNAIDWASRPSGEDVWHGVPVAIMGASGGLLGTIAAQLHLKQILAHLGAYVLPAPQIVVSLANEKITDGKLHDEDTRDRISKMLQEFSAYIEKLAL